MILLPPAPSQCGTLSLGYNKKKIITNRVDDSFGTYADVDIK